MKRVPRPANDARSAGRRDWLGRAAAGVVATLPIGHVRRVLQFALLPGLLSAGSAARSTERFRSAEPSSKPVMPAEVEAAIRSWSGPGAVDHSGLHIDLPEIVDNGNDVPLGIRFDEPVRPERRSGAPRVLRLSVWAPRNPQPLALEAEFTSACARADLMTRIRLATSQSIVVVARMDDGRIRRAEQPVLVALAACVES